MRRKEERRSEGKKMRRLEDKRRQGGKVVE
jgi:hypothetical protein